MQGALAGWIATLPMTIFMQLAWNGLPAREKYPLPPRLITRKLTTELGIRKYLRGKKQTALTLFLHFSYGAAAGTIYETLGDRFHLQHALKGMLAGLALWAGSYLVWLPALGILSPATRHPWRRNLLMIVAHLIWGLALGFLTREMNRNKSYIDLE
jgi:Predicted periplasmic/secreted protein